VCCNALQCVAVCYSVLQCVAVYSSVLQCIAMCCSVKHCAMYVWCDAKDHKVQCVPVSCCVCVAMCYSKLQCVAGSCKALLREDPANCFSVCVYALICIYI